MRKNWLFILTVAVVFLFAYRAHACTLYSEPVTNFDDWSTIVNYGEVQFLPSGSSLIVQATGGADGEFKHYFPAATGLMATVSILNAEGNARVGIQKVVGVLEGNKVIAELALEQWDWNRTIRYRIWIEDANLGTIDMVAVGLFGDWDSEWELEENITIAMARVENEIWFYVEGHGAIVKYCPLEDMEFIESYCQIFVWFKTLLFKNITANINNVNVLYCRERS